MLRGANDVRDLQFVIIDDAGQVIQRAAIGTRDHVVLFRRPFDDDFAADQILDHALAFAWHLQTHDALPTFGFEFGCGRFVFRHPASIVDKRLASFLGFFAKRLQFFRFGEIAVGVAIGEQFVSSGSVQIASLRLKVGTMRAADIGAFVPVHPEPTKTIQDRFQCRVDVSSGVRVIDPKNELSASLFREQPIEKCGADATDVQVSGWAGGKSRANHGRKTVGIKRCVGRPELLELGLD